MSVNQVMSEFRGIKPCSFPTGKKIPLLIATALCLAAWITSAHMAREFAIGMGFLTTMITLLSTCMKLPPMAMVLAAIAAVANAGSHFTAAHAIFKTRRNMVGGGAFCKQFQEITNGDDDMYDAYITEYRKYCSPRIYFAHFMAILLWIVAAICIFVAVPGQNGQNVETVDANGEPTTEYQRGDSGKEQQKESKSGVNC